MKNNEIYMSMSKLDNSSTLKSKQLSLGSRQMHFLVIFNSVSFTQLFFITFYFNCVIHVHVHFRLVIGLPDCASVQPWEIYHYPNSSDVLQLRPDGTLRHYLHHIIPGEEVDPGIENAGGANEMFYDYTQGLYCMDKVLFKLVKTAVVVDKINVSCFTNNNNSFLNLNERC